jgi:hypothetical protein
VSRVAASGHDCRPLVASGHDCRPLVASGHDCRPLVGTCRPPAADTDRHSHAAPDAPTAPGVGRTDASHQPTMFSNTTTSQSNRSAVTEQTHAADTGGAADAA